MKLKVLSVDHLRIDVLNLQECINWCLDVFDFKVYSHNYSYAIIGNEAIKLCLSEISQSDVKQFGDNCSPKILHFGLHIENWEDVLLKYKQMEGDDPIIFDWENDAESIYLYGPLGEIELTKLHGGNLDNPEAYFNNENQRKDGAQKESESDNSDSMFSLDEDF